MYFCEMYFCVFVVGLTQGKALICDQTAMVRLILCAVALVASAQAATILEYLAAATELSTLNGIVTNRASSLPSPRGSV
jgi:hypothetical protein